MKSAFEILEEQNKSAFDLVGNPSIATSRIINASDIVEPLLEELARERDNTVRVDNVSNITKPIVDALDNNNKRIDNLVRQIQTEDEKRSEGILNKLQGAVRGLISTETDKVRNEYKEQVKELQKQNKILIDGLKRIEKNTKVKGDVKNVIDTKEIAKEIEKMGDRLEKATREKTTILPPLNMDMFADSVGNRRTALINSDGRVNTVITAIAIDGASAGNYVEIGAKYNSTTGAYELLTAGSGGTTPSTANNILLQNGDNLLLQSGDLILKQ